MTDGSFSGAIPIVFQDPHLVAVIKPAGLLVHRSEIDRRENQFLVQTLRDQLKRHIHTVHRLDKPTSGLMLFAFDADTARSLSQAFMERGISKQYQAIVRGHIASTGLIDYDYTLRFDKRDQATYQRDKKVTARTRFECLELFEQDTAVGRYPTARHSLVRLLPETGARHQLRRHMKHIFHPIIGDTTYGDSRHNRYFRQDLSSHRLMLCATGLAFDHPCDGKAMEFSIDPDESFQFALDELRKNSTCHRLRSPSLSANLISAYSKTSYHITAADGVEQIMVVGRRDVDLRRYLVPPASSENNKIQSDKHVAAFVTAHNPKSERLNAEENEQRHRRLLAAVQTQGLHQVPAVAKAAIPDTSQQSACALSDQSGWPDERGVFLPAVKESVVKKLASNFEQNAAVVVRSDCIPRLLLIDT